MIDWSTLHAALARAVMRSSLGAVAREVEMTRPGLKRLLGGSKPMPKTERKVVRWYVRSLMAAPTPADEVLAAEAILGDIPEPLKGEMREQILAMVAAIRAGRS